MRSLVFAMLLIGACGTAPPPAASTPAGESRIKDSPREKIAANRAAARGLRLEDEEQRWGTEQAAERKRKEAAARTKPDSRARTGVDIRQGK